jgi:hypothetical protein
MVKLNLREFHIQNYFNPNGIIHNIASCEFTKNRASSSIKITCLSWMHFMLQYIMNQTVYCTLWVIIIVDRNCNLHCGAKLHCSNGWHVLMAACLLTKVDLGTFWFVLDYSELCAFSGRKLQSSLQLIDICLLKCKINVALCFEKLQNLQVLFPYT